MVRERSHFQNLHILFKMPVFKKIYIIIHAKKQETIALIQGQGVGENTVNKNILLGHPNVRLNRQINIAAIKNMVKD